MKNHHKHLIGAAPLPEVHSVQGKRKFKGSNSGDPKNKHEKQNFNKKQKSNQKDKQGGDAKAKNDTKCHRCGTFNHFAKDCRTPKHLVALYQKSLKGCKAKQG
jgi:membrane protease subunit (stomatin/prohibitin family)